MKERFLKLTLPEKLIVVSTFIAIASLLLNWVSLQTIKQNGLQQGTYLFLIIFVYPILKIIRNKIINKTYGYLLAIIGILLGLNYVQMKSYTYEGALYTAAGLGPFIFILACSLMLFGVWRYKREEER